MPRRIFPAGTVTNITGAPLRLTFYQTSTTNRRETDLWTVDGSNNLSAPIPNGVILTNSASSAAYSAFAGPDDIDVLYLNAHTGSSRTSIAATGYVASNTGDHLTPVTVTSSATATLNGLHLVDTTSAAVTLTLPSGGSGDRIAVVKTNVHQNYVTLSGSIDVTTTRVLRSLNSYWLGQWDGSAWRTVGGDTGYLGGSSYGATVQSGTVLRKWAKALANVRTGTASAKILCVGDSTTIGAGTSTTHEWQASWPTVLAELMNSTVAPTMVGLGVPESDLAVAVTDDRWGIGAGWVNAGSASNLGWGGTGCLTAPTSAASALTYTSGIIADTYDVYWLRSSATGTFSIAATGGSTTNISAGGATGVVKTTVTSPTATASNVVTITPTDAANPIYIVGVEPSLSAYSCVKVGNPAQDGSKATGWTQSTSLGGAPCIRAYAPDLTFINLGINDGGAGISTGSLSTATQTLITAAQVSGDVILVGISPTSTAANTDALRTSYIPVLRSLAEVNGCGWIAVQDRLGAYSAANTLGIMAGDGLHPNALGHADIAKAMLRAVDI